MDTVLMDGESAPLSIEPKAAKMSPRKGPRARSGAKDLWTLYFNPHCGTCLKVKERLESRGIQPKLVEYLRTPPTVKSLDRLLTKMGKGPAAITRFKEPFWMEQRHDPDKLDRKEWLTLLAENPFLIQRPIVETKERAVVARPPEETDVLFSD